MRDRDTHTPMQDAGRVGIVIKWNTLESYFYRDVFPLTWFVVYVTADLIFVLLMNSSLV